VPCFFPPPFFPPPPPFHRGQSITTLSAPTNYLAIGLPLVFFGLFFPHFFIVWSTTGHSFTLMWFRPEPAPPPASCVLDKHRVGLIGSTVDRPRPVEHLFLATRLLSSPRRRTSKPFTSPLLMDNLMSGAFLLSLSPPVCERTPSPKCFSHPPSVAAITCKVSAHGPLQDSLPPFSPSSLSSF